MISLNGTPLNQDLSNPFFWIENKFTDIFKVGNQLITLQSNTNLSQTPQSLAVTPGQFANLINQGKEYERLTQDVSVNSFVSENAVSLTKKLKRFTFAPQIGVDIEKQRLESNLSYSDGENDIGLKGKFANHLDWRKVNAYLKIKTQYRKDAWRVELDSPLNYYKFDIKDKVAGKEQRLERLVFEPRLTANYQISPFWSTSGGMNYGNRFGEIDNVFYGYLLKNYRTLQRRDTPLQNSQTLSGNIGLDYKNPLSSLFGNVNYRYSSSRNNLLYRSKINPTGTTEYSAIDQLNYSHLRLISGRVSKYFSAVKTNINSSLSFMNTESDQLLNGTLTTVTNNSINPGLGLSTNFNKIVDVEYGYRLSYYKSNLGAKEQNTFQRKQLLNLNIYPNSISHISVENEYYVSNLTTGLARNLFTSLLFRYSLPKKKIDLETRWTNVWDTSTFATSSLTSFSYIESVYELRPMQIVQKVRFSF